MNLKRLGREIGRYGLGEVAYRKLYQRTRDPRDRERMFVCRDRAYRRFNRQQMEEELCTLYRNSVKRELNLANPRGFTEKIQWLKLYDNTPEKTRLADKYLVRVWVEERIGKGHLIPLLGAWDDIDEIDFDRLPDRFCLKMNHGSGMNCVVKDKSRMDLREVRRDFKRWEQSAFCAKTLEFQYRDIPRKVLAEEYMEEQDGGLNDYKIHCFGGKPKFIQCIGDRNLERHQGYQCVFDLDWNALDWTFEDYPDFPYAVPRPERLGEMLNCAVKLSEGFCYVRVDLYEARGRVYFGEMTFTPASGLYKYRGRWTWEKDVEIGDMLELPAKP